MIKLYIYIYIYIHTHIICLKKNSLPLWFITRGTNLGKGEEAVGATPLRGSISQRSPGNIKWCVRVSWRKAFLSCMLTAIFASHLFRKSRSKILSDKRWSDISDESWNHSAKHWTKDQGDIGASQIMGYCVVSSRWWVTMLVLETTQPKSRGIQDFPSGPQARSRDQTAACNNAVWSSFYYHMHLLN